MDNNKIIDRIISKERFEPYLKYHNNDLSKAIYTKLSQSYHDVAGYAMVKRKGICVFSAKQIDARRRHLLFCALGGFFVRIGYFLRGFCVFGWESGFWKSMLFCNEL